MTKSITAKGRARAARVACRKFRQGENGHYISCLFRPGGHIWDDDRERRTYPTLPPGVTDTWRWHGGTVYGVTVILEGSGRLHANGAVRELEAGDVVLFTGLAHGLIRYDEGTDFMETSLSFDGFMGMRLVEMGLWPEDTRRRRADPKAARVQFEALFHAIEVLSVAPAELLRRAVQLLGWVDRLGEVEAARANEDFAIRASMLLRERAGPADRIEEVAHELGYSPPHFRRLFRQAMGISPSAYQLRERMARAAVLLRDHDVKGVAHALGYSDPFVFSRQFKAQVGVSPSVFAASLR